MVKGDCGLTKNQTCFMINAKMFSDFCCGMNINSGFTMSVFRDHPWNSFYSKPVKFVCKAVGRNGIKARIGAHYFTFTFCCRVAYVHGNHIVLQALMDFGQGFKKPVDYLTSVRKFL